jgi:hypothetical protein
VKHSLKKRIARYSQMLLLGDYLCHFSVLSVDKRELNELI